MATREGLADAGGAKFQICLARLSPELWPMAAAEQAKRATHDPWVDVLREAMQHLEEGEPGKLSKKISMSAVWTILDVRGAQQTQDQSRRVGDAMRKLGWRRPNDAGTVKIGGELVSGFVKGEKPWQTIRANRLKETGLHVLLLP